MPDELPILLFATPAELEAWLEERHAESRGLWLKIAKKGTEPPSVTYAEALELALCFGWIDSQKRGLDERHFLQRFTPIQALAHQDRRQQSHASAHAIGVHERFLSPADSAVARFPRHSAPGVPETPGSAANRRASAPIATFMVTRESVDHSWVRINFREPLDRVAWVASMGHPSRAGERLCAAALKQL